MALRSLHLGNQDKKPESMARGFLRHGLDVCCIHEMPCAVYCKDDTYPRSQIRFGTLSDQQGWLTGLVMTRMCFANHPTGLAPMMDSRVSDQWKTNLVGMRCGCSEYS